MCDGRTGRRTGKTRNAAYEDGRIINQLMALTLRHGWLAAKLCGL